MKIPRSMWYPFGCILGLALISGCSNSGPSTYPVSGHVFYSDGQPLPGGVVALESLEDQEKRNPRGTIEPDGSFTLKTHPDREGAEPGKYRVMVQAFDPAFDDEKLRPGQRAPQLIHSRYGKFETSGLEVTVEAKQDNDLTIRVDRP